MDRNFDVMAFPSDDDAEAAASPSAGTAARPGAAASRWQPVGDQLELRGAAPAEREHQVLAAIVQERYRTAVRVRRQLDFSDEFAGRLVEGPQRRRFPLASPRPPGC